ncbi:MAG: hypothetical protein ACJAZB_000226 [Psychrosphaera sp.]|jgi:hypothetical protein
MDLISIFLIALPIYIALPFIYWIKHKHKKRKDKSSVLVLNHKLLANSKTYSSTNLLTPEQIDRICHQLKLMQRVDSELQKAKS